MGKMKRGDVYWTSFDKSAGGEIRKTRPAVIVSCNAANRVLNRVQIVPLTSMVASVYPSEALVRVGDRVNKAMADQLATVSKTRLKERLTTLESSDMMNIDRILRIQLGLQ
jgi:mRNA interferase MazF